MSVLEDWQWRCSDFERTQILNSSRLTPSAHLCCNVNVIYINIMKFPNMIEMQLWENKPSKKKKTLLSSGIDSLTCSEVLKETAGYLHSIVHGRDSVYAAFTNRVGADPDVLLQLVHVGELGWASVQLERAGIINIYTVSCDITKKKKSSSTASPRVLHERRWRMQVTLQLVYASQQRVSNVRASW